MTRTAAPLPRTRSWSAVQCRLGWRAEDIDHFLVHRARPLLDKLRRSGQLADWYFQRTDGGVLFGVRGADWCTVKALRSDLARLIAQARRPGDAASADIGETAHAPDPARFGGAVAAAEDVFCRAAELALTTLAVPGARLTAATELIMATAHALRMDRAATAAWLGGSAGEGAQPLDVRWSRLARTRDHAIVRWTNAVRRARRAAEGHAEAPPSGQWPAVWREQLHLLLNQLGVTQAEVAALCLCTASSLSVRDPRAADPAYPDLATAV